MVYRQIQDNNIAQNILQRYCFLLGLFQPEGDEQTSNKGFNQNMTNQTDFSSTQLRNPEGERPRSNSTIVQSETRGKI